MKRFLCFCLMGALLSPGFGMGIALSENAVRTESDVIAHVIITATAPVESAPETKSDPSTDRFERVATARVITAVKGCKAGDSLSLLFDNGFGCPNVIYAEKEECLVFLKKDTAGVYRTMNLYCGRFSVNDGQVADFYLMGPVEKTPASTPLKTVIDWLLTPPVKP